MSVCVFFFLTVRNFVCPSQFAVREKRGKVGIELCATKLVFVNCYGLEIGMLGLVCTFEMLF